MFCIWIDYNFLSHWFYYSPGLQFSNTRTFDHLDLIEFCTVVDVCVCSTCYNLPLHTIGVWSLSSGCFDVSWEQITYQLEPSVYGSEWSIKKFLKWWKCSISVLTQLGVALLNIKCGWIWTEIYWYYVCINSHQILWIMTSFKTSIKISLSLCWLHVNDECGSSQVKYNKCIECSVIYFTFHSAGKIVITFMVTECSLYYVYLKE